jgi:hypothetical protein
MVSKWDTLDIDHDMIGNDVDLNAIMTRPPTREEVALFCDKNFPHLHLANVAEEALSGEGMTLTQKRLPCGWFVFSYRRGDTYLLMMTSRYAGRPDAPLPVSAPTDMMPKLLAQDEDEGNSDSDGGDAWDDEGGGARELGWHGMSRLAAAEMIDFAREKGMTKTAVIGGTQYMVESAYLAATSFGDDFSLSTDLSQANKKRLKNRIDHLMKSDGQSFEPTA